MSHPRPTAPELLLIAAFSRHPEALQWAREQLVPLCGPIGLESQPYRFDQTSYYQDEMGTDLQKVLFAFEQLVPPEALPDIKLRTIALEDELARTCRFAERRPLNLDPGLLNLGKFLLATTKDQQHRIYLRDGIFAEVTLRFQDGDYHPWPWTYADYRQECVLAFMGEAREFYKLRSKCSG